MVNQWPGEVQNVWMVAALLVVGHLLVAATWFGAMGYSLGVVQPRASRLFAADPQTYELLATTLAAGARWKVVGVLAFLGGSGVGLVVVTDADARDGWWWAVVGVKAVLLIVASVVFWYVSWRMWPRRLFALPSELPQRQREFRQVGGLLAVVAGIASALGGVAAVLAR
jgi:hypothetical protein